MGPTIASHLQPASQARLTHSLYGVRQMILIYASNMNGTTNRKGQRRSLHSMPSYVRELSLELKVMPKLTVQGDSPSCNTLRQNAACSTLYPVKTRLMIAARPAQCLHHFPVSVSAHRASQRETMHVLHRKGMHTLAQAYHTMSWSRHARIQNFRFVLTGTGQGSPTTRT